MCVLHIELLSLVNHMQWAFNCGPRQNCSCLVFFFASLEPLKLASLFFSFCLSVCLYVRTRDCQPKWPITLQSMPIDLLHNHHQQQQKNDNGLKQQQCVCVCMLVLLSSMASVCFLFFLLNGQFSFFFSFSKVNFFWWMKLNYILRHGIATDKSLVRECRWMGCPRKRVWNRWPKNGGWLVHVDGAKRSHLIIKTV